MLKWLTLLVDDARSAEARLLPALLKESPEFPDWSAAVRPVLARLLEGNRLKRPVVCRVLDMPVFNAFALPHRTIILSQLLVEFCRDRRDQLAFILGHELAHIHLGHARRRSVANGLLTLAPLANPLLGLGLGLLFDRAYTREQEFEADAWSVRLAARTGFAPAASVALLERLGHGAAPGNLVGQMLSTHPPLADRMQQLHAAIRECQRRGPAFNH